MTYIPIQTAQQLNNESQEQQLLTLKMIERHLAEMTDLELKEEDTNDSD